MLEIHNSLGGKQAQFKSLRPNEVRMYVCGMTVYDYIHIGHARMLTVFDLVQRYLRASGFKVTYVRNITDIDDKIIQRAAENGEDWAELARRFTRAMHEDCATLGLAPPDIEPRATDYIEPIIAMTRTLIDKGFAYVAANRDVMYSVRKFAHYGALSGKKLDDLRAGSRVQVDEFKLDPLDFVLWKHAKPGEPTWPSPWGPGRPGWHIECSAMSRRHLGDQIDIHGGATDLIFPHHENEIAQTESCTGLHPMAAIWMHAGLLNVDGQKMSKSLGNFMPLVDLLKRHSWAAIRYFFLQTGYRKPTNFTDSALEAATKGLRGLYADIDALRAMASERPARSERLAEAEEFDQLLDDDLNTAGAIGWLQKRLKAERT